MQTLTFLSEQEVIRCGISGDKTIQFVNKYPVYMKDLKSSSAKFRGSTNQRAIDVKSSLKENRIILHEF